MQSLITACLVFAAACTWAADAGMVTKSFDVLPTLTERISAARSEMGEFQARDSRSEESRDDLKDFYRQFGVDWPEGSSIKYVPSIGRIIVRNTPENMAKFEAILATLNVVPTQIEVEVDFVQFPLVAVEPLVQRGGVTVDTLRELWRSGKGVLLASPVTVTQSGAEATVKGVEEYIYPTEFTVTTPLSTNQPDTNQLSAIRFQEGELSQVVEPGGFETREAGAILQVLPEITTDGLLINLTMSPQFVCEPIWKDYGFEVASSNGPPRKFKMEMPFFHTYVTSTSVGVRNGQTLLIGGGVPNQDGQKLVFMFVTARKIDLSGKRLSEKE